MIRITTKKDKDGSFLYVDIIEVQRLYDLLRSNVYNHVQSVGLETFEVELLSNYLRGVRLWELLQSSAVVIKIHI